MWGGADLIRGGGGMMGDKHLMADYMAKKQVTGVCTLVSQIRNPGPHPRKARKQEVGVCIPLAPYTLSPSFPKPNLVSM